MKIKINGLHKDTRVLIANLDHASQANGCVEEAQILFNDIIPKSKEIEIPDGYKDEILLVRMRHPWKQFIDCHVMVYDNIKLDVNQIDI